MGWQPSSRRNSSHWAPGTLSIQVSLYQQKICKCWRCIKTYAGNQTRGDYFMPTILFSTKITDTIQKLQMRKAYTVVTNNWGASAFLLRDCLHFVWWSLRPFFLYHLITLSVQSFGVMITLWPFCSIIHHIKFKQHRVKSSSASCEKAAFFYKMSKFLKKKTPPFNKLVTWHWIHLCFTIWLRATSPKELIWLSEAAQKSCSSL